MSQCWRLKALLCVISSYDEAFVILLCFRNISILRVQMDKDFNCYGIAPCMSSWICVFFLPGSPYTNTISSAILKLKETGVLHKLKTRWWKERKGGGRCTVRFFFLKLTPVIVFIFWWFISRLRLTLYSLNRMAVFCIPNCTLFLSSFDDVIIVAYYY